MSFNFGIEPVYFFSYYSDTKALYIHKSGVIIAIMTGEPVRRTLIAFLSLNDADLQTVLARYDITDIPDDDTLNAH